MAYDPDRHQVVLFGGVGPQGFMDDTWKWSGQTWSQLHPAHAPSRREMAGLTWDSSLHMLVLFGGVAAGGVAMNDTWVWSGTDWQERFPTHCPTPRAPSGFAFDEISRRLVMFGARTTSSNDVDTWLWDGNDWSRLLGTAPAANTSNSATIGMAWDPAAKSVTLVDFRSPAGLGVTYWRLGTDAWGPANRIQVGRWGDSNVAAYDPGRNLWVFYGAQSSVEIAGLVVFDGVSLTGFRPSTHPAPTDNSIATAYDSDLREILMFGGNSLDGPTAELWAWDFQQFTRP